MVNKIRWALAWWIMPKNQRGKFGYLAAFHSRAKIVVVPKVYRKIEAAATRVAKNQPPLNMGMVWRWIHKR